MVRFNLIIKWHHLLNQRINGEIFAWFIQNIAVVEDF